MADQDPINRMSEKSDFEHLRETSAHPTWTSRAWSRVSHVLTNRTVVTITLAVTIVAVLAIAYLVIS